MHLQRTPIDSGWSFKQADGPDSAFLPVAQFPTNIHLDLMHHGKIPDPLLDANAAEVQWVGEEPWIYRTKFSGSGVDSTGLTVELVFEGLDTHASVFLNNKEIKKTDSMYIAYRVNVTGQIKAENELEIRFDPTFSIGKQLEKEAKDKPLFFHNGDSSRLQVRKAPYSYGWDWGPTLLTCGPWRPIYLETFTARFTDLCFEVDVNESVSFSTVKATAELEGSFPETVQFKLFDPAGTLIHTKSSTPENGIAQTKFEIHRPQLWFPRGNGSQPLYTLEATAFSTSQSTVLCSSSKRLGIRRVRLVQRPLKKHPGTTFYFEINNVPIFSRGANWIPTDMCLPRITPERYRAWIEFAANGNHNMIRVWGGGIYEDDIFYGACDELGIMVWQDFQLACGSYPATPKFLQAIEEEAVYNLKRMRSHPSIVLWCGNNEDHMFADRYNAQYDPDDLNPDNWLKTNWPGRIIYDKVLKELCGKYVPETPYHPGSPWGGRPSNDPTVGDIHAWGVWMKASEQYPYQYYPNLSGRFVSEFGLKSYPALKTVENFITNPKERYPQSRMMDAHQKSSSKTPWARDNRTIALYIVENFKHGYTMPQYVYASQLAQAEAMTYAFAGWRRLWKGHGHEECAGALVWQLNDAWPCVSWALGDYYLRPKYAYFTTKRSLAPLSVGVARVEVEESRDSEFTDVHIHRVTRIQVWGSNFTVVEERMELLVQGFDFESGKCIWEERKEGVTLVQNQSTELFDKPLHAALIPTIVSARLLKDGKVIARFSDWPQPLKHLDLPKAAVDLIVRGDYIHVSSSLPVKGLALAVDDDLVKLEDNCIDLVPGDEQVIHAKGLNGRSVSFMHLGIAAD